MTRLSATDRECDCPPGWRHEPTCPEVTGIRPRMHQQLDDPVQVRDDNRPVHRPYAPDAPIPGVHHYSGCDPDHPRVDMDGICDGCGESACPECGYGDPCQCEAAA